MDVIHRVQRADRLASFEMRASRNADVDEFAARVRRVLESRVAERNTVHISAEPDVDIAHSRHSDQFAKRAEILGGDRPEHLFVADKPCRLAV